MPTRPFISSTSNAIRRWLAATFAFAAVLCSARGQTIEGQPIASQFGEYLVTDQGTGFSFSANQCNVLGAGTNFPAFTSGVAVKVLDPQPGFTEVSTAVSAFVTGSTCAVSLGGLAHPHVASFSLTSGTGGLQEALNNSKVPPGLTNTIILNSRWYELIAPRSAAIVIGSVVGSAQFGLVDITTNPYTSYSWNGSHYVASTTASAVTFPGSSGLVFNTSSTQSRTATSADISGLIAGATVDPANLNGTIYAAGVNGGGIGVAQTVWSPLTAYPQCAAALSGGNNYLAVSANTNVIPGSDAGTWWPVPNAGTPTNGDCGFYIAASFVRGAAGAELILPPGNTNTCIGFMEPTVLNPGSPNVVIRGAGKYASVLTQTCNILSSGNAVVQQPDSGVAYAYAGVDWEGFTVNANFLAAAAMNVYGAQQYKIHHVLLENPADGSDHYIEFGHPAGVNHPLAWTNEMDLEDIDTQDAHGAGRGASITAAVSGGVPAFTVVSGGGGFNPAYSQLILSGTGNNADTPCSNRGADTINISGGVITSITTTATGCTAPLYASVFGGNAVTYCFKFNDASDSKMITALTPTGCNTAVFNANITSMMSFYKTHPIATYIGISEAGNNSFWGTQMDTIYRYGFDFEGAGNVDNVYGSKFEWSTSMLNGSSDYHFGTINNSPVSAPYAINIFGDACGNSATFNGYNHFLPASGNVESSGGALPSFVHAYNSQSCDQTTSTANAANYIGQNFSLGNGTAGSVFNFGLGHGLSGGINVTYPSNNGNYNWNFQNATAATNSNNYGSPQLQLGGSYWNGLASTSSYVQMQTLFGAGNNPAQTIQFSMGGTPSSGARSYSFDNPVTAPNLTDAALAAGNCVQAGPGGILTTTSAACGTGTGSSGTVTTGTAYSPAYYSANGSVVAGTTPFSGLQFNSTSAAPAAATAAQVQGIIGAGQVNGVATLDLFGRMPQAQLATSVPLLTATTLQAFNGPIVAPQINNVFWVDGFSDTAYQGIGQAQVAWASGTTYPLCQAVSSGGVNYLATNSLANTTTPGSNSAAWYPVPTNDAPTQTECAFYWALAQAANSAVVLKFGGLVTTSYLINGPLLMPPNGGQVELIGESRGDNGTPVQIFATQAMTAMISKPDLVVAASTPYNLHLAHLVLNGNNLALHGFDFDGAKVGLIEHVNVKNMVGTDYWVRIGDGTAGNLGYDYQWVVNDVQLESNGTAPTSWASVTTTVSGGVPTFTLNSGGSYNYATPIMDVWGTGASGTSAQPCTTMGTITLTMSSSAPYSVSAINASGFSGCGGTIYTVIPDQPAAQYGFFLDYVTDSSFTDLIDNGVGTVAGIITNHSGNSFLHAHPYGVPVGIISTQQNMFVNTELDSTFIYGAEPNARDNWSNTNFTYNRSYPGTKGFYTGSQTLFSSLGSTCGGTAQPSGFALVTTATGDITHGTAAVYPGSFRVEGQQCDDASMVEALPAQNLSNGSTATTQSVGDTSTKVATDAFVLANVSASAAVSSFNARTGAVVPASGDYTVAQVTGAAPLAGPAFTSTPTAPTQTAGDNSTRLATTAYVAAPGAIAPTSVTASGASTFSAAGVASTPGLTVSGAPYTAGTATTNFPQIYYNCSGATAPVSWSIAGTIFGTNACSGFTGNPIDVHVNGGGSIFAVSYQGDISNVRNATGSGSLAISRGTFSGAGAASSAGVTISGAPYTGGTATTNFPQEYLNCSGATAANSLSTAGTVLGINACSGFTGHLINLFVNGGSTRFRVDYLGNAFIAGTETVASTLALSSTTAPTIANGAGAGTSPGTPAILGNNNAGVITVITGTATTANSTLATITFNGTLGTVPQGCGLTPRNAAATGANLFYITAPTSTTFTVGVGGTAAAASTTYSWSFLCF